MVDEPARVAGELARDGQVQIAVAIEVAEAGVEQADRGTTPAQRAGLEEPAAAVVPQAGDREADDDRVGVAVEVEVRLDGAPILSGSAPIAAGLDYTVAAHLDAGGMPRLAVLQNGLQPLTLPASRLWVRHLAQAPAVDAVENGLGHVVAAVGDVAQPSRDAVGGCC